MRHCRKAGALLLMLLWMPAGPELFAKTKTIRRHTVRCATCARDSRGRIRRSPEARAEFRRTHPCPSTGRTAGPCPGYVIDHVIPLKRGGPDRPSNMQWQTKAAAKAKDRVE
jgi:5-methylcytosine-specific restriction endonuclease McrA